MDPDKALAIIRKLADSVTEFLDDGSPLAGQAADLALQVTALDDWLACGGTLPAAWNVPRASTAPALADWMGNPDRPGVRDVSDVPPLWPAHLAECERNVPAADCDCWQS